VEHAIGADRVRRGWPANDRAPPQGWREPARRLRRRLEAVELDLDAMIDHKVARRMGEASDGRVFEERRLPLPSVSLLLLLDFSASCNDRIDARDTTVLDIEKQAVENVIAALEPTAVRIALHGFASNGRHDFRHFRIKVFDETFDDEQRGRLRDQQAAFSLAWARRCGTRQRNSINSEAKRSCWCLLRMASLPTLTFMMRLT
jgi:hypothetical protein